MSADASASTARRIIIDTDPGVDDALAILLALACESSLVVEALTIVCGNGKDITKLGANAKLLARTAGCPSVPVCLGDAPLDEGEAAQEIPVHVHGKDGLGDVSAQFGHTVRTLLVSTPRRRPSSLSTPASRIAAKSRWWPSARFPTWRPRSRCARSCRSSSGRW